MKSLRVFLGGVLGDSSALYLPTYSGVLDVKDTDLVEDPKYVGDASFLIDMPDKPLPSTKTAFF